MIGIDVEKITKPFVDQMTEMNGLLHQVVDLLKEVKDLLADK